MRNRAVNALIEMGMPANIKGFDYIVDAMCLFDEDESWKFGKTTDLYRKLAQINKTTSSRVERAIRHAFQNILIKGNLKAVEKYLTFYNTANSNLLAVFYIKLLQEGEKHED